MKKSTTSIKSGYLLPEMPESESEWFAAVLGLVRFLRSPEGCPWDRKQHARDFAGFVREETEELIEALEQGDKEAVSEEWGDTLFTLLAVAAAAEEEGIFDPAQALRGAHEKMIRRHAHIFGGHKADTPEEVIGLWNRIKEQEKADRANRSQQP